MEQNVKIVRSLFILIAVCGVAIFSIYIEEYGLLYILGIAVIVNIVLLIKAINKKRSGNDGND
ncbi:MULTISPECIES: hypothetical protein [Staphylococcus]|uniref:hypothetical protein n=1 Tax=Staphylococcus TaxID=1279 RepID=UPI000D1C9A6B|nr:MULTISPECIES: hypothetical protein [Staphylococcus]HBC7992018.1 hypothetical protein [Staphylococcus aureus]PTF17377.1 hypothetical protein BUY40_12505 [Staphylococcus cohnii]PTK09913.1 hypothetical protein BUZ75_12080 [Staphylococcus saprophyticus]PTK15825.1 hypothetical protein BUZ72_11855 [Staphylococcus saprophyticus]PTK43604.1 hypothetical protein BUZ69_13325 [Staphylococcus saprophyticus]